MKFLTLLGLAIGFLPVFVGISAQAEMLTLGRSSGGAIIKLDTDSIPRVSRRAGSSGTPFTYYLGNEKISAEAICSRGLWTVEGKQYKPQSQATRNMLSVACGLRWSPVEDMGTVLVFDPPSNVRTTPNGAVKCKLEMSVIDVYVEPRGEWYSTSAWVVGGYTKANSARYVEENAHTGSSCSAESVQSMPIKPFANVCKKLADQVCSTPWTRFGL